VRWAGARGTGERRRQRKWGWCTRLWRSGMVVTTTRARLVCRRPRGDTLALQRTLNYNLSEYCLQKVRYLNYSVIMIRKGARET